MLNFHEHVDENVLARRDVCKPNSADCERLISAYSLMKTCSRKRLQCQTINNTPYVNIHMPVLSQYDQRPAVDNFTTERQRRDKG